MLGTSHLANMKPRRGEVWAQIVVTADSVSLICLSHPHSVILTAKGIAELENLFFFFFFMA